MSSLAAIYHQQREELGQNVSLADGQQSETRGQYRRRLERWADQTFFVRKYLFLAGMTSALLSGCWTGRWKGGFCCKTFKGKTENDENVKNFDRQVKRQILQAFQVQTAVILGLKVYIWTILKETQTTLIFLAAVFSESKVKKGPDMIWCDICRKGWRSRGTTGRTSSTPSSYVRPHKRNLYWKYHLSIFGRLTRALVCGK